MRKHEDDLEITVSSLEDFTQNLRQVESDLEQVIDIFSDQRPVSHDIDIIKEQQEEFKVIISDVSSISLASYRYLCRGNSVSVFIC